MEKYLVFHILYGIDLNKFPDNNRGKHGRDGKVSGISCLVQVCLTQ
jgi:hypothetical protein